MLYLLLLSNILCAVLLGYIAFAMVRSIASGAPFIPTLRRHLEPIVRMADLRPDDIVIELGSGDGRFCIAAAKAGVRRAVGYDISRPLVWWARQTATREGVADRAQFERGNIMRTDCSGATLIYLYLMPRITNALAEGPLRSLRPGARVLTAAFPIDTAANPQFRLVRSELFGSVRAFLYVRV